MLSKEEIIEIYRKTNDKYLAVRRIAAKNKTSTKEIFDKLRDWGVIGNGAGAVQQHNKKVGEVKKQGAETMNVKSTKYTEEEIELIQSLKAQGFTWKEIEAKTGRPAKSMSNTFSAMKKQKEKKQTKKNETVAETVDENVKPTESKRASLEAEEKAAERKQPQRTFVVTSEKMKRLQDNLIQFIQAAVQDVEIEYGSFQEISKDHYGKIEINANAGNDVYTFEVHCCRLEDTECL